jgi:acetyl-CoA carboxylase biotin carboxylase subunit
VIEKLIVPGGYGIRWDSHAYQGYSISPFYDSMFAKLIAWGADRTAAIETMQRALDELTVEGIQTSIPFHRAILRDLRFRQGRFSTDFIQLWLEETELSKQE